MPTTRTPLTSGRWDEAEGVEPRGTVIVLGGRGESPAAYARFGRRLSADAYRVRAVGDVSAGRTRAVELAKHLVREGGVRPLVLLGADAGAILALRIAAAAPDRLDGVIAVGLPIQRRSVAEGVPQLPLRTASSEHWAALADPLVIDPRGLSRPVSRDLELPEPGAVTTPVLALHGDEDAVAPLDEALDYYAGIPNVRVVSVERGRHDSLNDAAHRSVAATIVLFLEGLRAGIPSVVDVPLPSEARR